MCKNCYSSTAWNEMHYRRQGAVEPDDFEKEVNYTPKKKKKHVKKYPGCPGNNGGAHIYVWTTEYNTPTLFYDYYGFHKHEQRVCCGCGHKDKVRKSAEYAERNAKEKDKAARKGKRTWKYWSFEDYDEDYRRVRRDYITRRGWDDYVYGIYLW